MIIWNHLRKKLIIKRKINIKKAFKDYKVVIDKDISMAGKLFTPIGGGKILQYMDNTNNYFAGSFDGNNKTISDLLVITNSNSGLFGSSISKSIQNVTVSNGLFIATEGSMGALVATQGNEFVNTRNSEKTEISDITVSNNTYLHNL